MHSSLGAWAFVSHFNVSCGHRNLKRLLSSSPRVFTSHLVPLIGLEIHARLLTRSKVFSRSPYDFGAPPNTQVALLDAAVPGSMPLLNKRCVELALRIALALQARVNMTSQFDRKHYFYADSPAGYQITQYWKPIAEGGFLDYIWPIDSLKPNAHLPVATERVTDRLNQSHLLSRARFKRIQIEQDTGKSLHDERQGRTLVDLNRSGVGLVELVTEPDFSHSVQAASFVSELANLLSFLECSNADASQGDLRVDVNVSVGTSLTSQGMRTEVKNVNSVRAVERAIQFEIDRQIGVVQSGGSVINETRSYDPVHGITLPMRDKEVIQDYRYMPEPDLLPLRLRSTCESCSPEGVSPSTSNSQSLSLFRPTPRLCLQCATKSFSDLLQAKTFGELPHKIRRRLLLDHNIPWDRASVLVENPSLYVLYTRCRDVLLSSPRFNSSASDEFSEVNINRELSYWIVGQLVGMLRKEELTCLPIPERLSEFVELSLSGRIYGTGAQQLFALATADPTLANITCVRLAEDRGWLLINDIDRMRASCEQVIRDCPKHVKLYHEGKRKKALKRLAQRLISQTSYGAEKFNPYIVEKLLTHLLEQNSSENTASTVC